MILADYPGHFIATVLLLAAAVLLIFAYRTDKIRNVKGWRWLLGILHYASIAVLLFIIWDPSASTFKVTKTKNNVLVFFDTSESMSITDAGGQSRLDAAVEIFQNKFKPGEPNRPEYKIFGFGYRILQC